MAKLTEADVYDIVDSVMNGASILYLSEKYNIKTGTIRNILRGNAWSTITNGGNNSNINSKGINPIYWYNDISTLYYTNPKMRKYNAALTIEDTIIIAKYFESININDKEPFPTIGTIFSQCFKDTGLNEKYKWKDKHRALEAILYKTPSSIYYPLIKDFNYNYLG